MYRHERIAAFPACCTVRKKTSVARWRCAATGRTLNWRLGFSAALGRGFICGGRLGDGGGCVLPFPFGGACVCDYCGTACLLSLLSLVCLPSDWRSTTTTLFRHIQIHAASKTPQQRAEPKSNDLSRKGCHIVTLIVAITVTTTIVVTIVVTMVLAMTGIVAIVVATIIAAMRMVIKVFIAIIVLVAIVVTKIIGIVDSPQTIWDHLEKGLLQNNLDYLDGVSQKPTSDLSKKDRTRQNWKMFRPNLSDVCFS